MIFVSSNFAYRTEKAIAVQSGGFLGPCLKVTEYSVCNLESRECGRTPCRQQVSQSVSQVRRRAVVLAGAVACFPRRSLAF